MMTTKTIIASLVLTILAGTIGCSVETKEEKSKPAPHDEAAKKQLTDGQDPAAQNSEQTVETLDLASLPEQDCSLARSSEPDADGNSVHRFYWRFDNLKYPNSTSFFEIYIPTDKLPATGDAFTFNQKSLKAYVAHLGSDGGFRHSLFKTANDCTLTIKSSRQEPEGEPTVSAETGARSTMYEFEVTARIDCLLEGQDAARSVKVAADLSCRGKNFVPME